VGGGAILKLMARGPYLNSRAGAWGRFFNKGDQNYRELQRSQMFHGRWVLHKFLSLKVNRGLGVPIV